jgi:endonuclease YncB( thermonuclease family)
VQRRNFLSGLAGAGVASGLGVLGTSTAVARGATVEPLAFDSTGSLLNANGEPLTDDSLVPVWAESVATNVDEDGDGNATTYPDGTDIPLVAVDDSASGAIVGIGCPFVSNDADFSKGNEEFLCNLLDDVVGSGTVRWDEGHDQYYTLDTSGGGPGFSKFASYAGENGYTFEATTDVAGDAASADAIVVTSPSASFSDSEQSALADFVANGGVVVLVDQSDFSGFDETQNLNDLASGLDAQFRFNDDQVLDAENNAGSDFVPTTTNFNESAFASYFQDRDGIESGNELDPSKTYTVDVVGVADGDTVDVQFDDGTVESIRVLGVDTAEKKGNGQYERPEEWEGLADGVVGLSGVSELTFAEGAAPLLNANGEPLTDAARVPVFAEPSAAVQDGDGNGDAVTYPDATDIPLAAVDGGVVGLGSVLVNDDKFDAANDNEEFVCNLWTALVGDGGVVRWDDSHDQFFSSDKFGTFADYAADNGFEVQSGSEIPSDTSDADALVVTSPSAFSEDELAALSSFVDAGGAVFLHDQDDYNDYDQTGNLNAIAEALDVSFRFNDAQVVDAENNTGQDFAPTTTNLNQSAFPTLFAKRTGLDDDGSGSELPDADYPYLAYHADLATQFAQDALENETIDISFDPLGSEFNGGVRDPFGRVLAYIEYDADGSGSRDTVYNKQLIEGGYARVYESGLSRLGEFLSAETAARTAGTGIWTRSNTRLSPVIRNDPVEDVYVPKAERVETTSGSLPRARVPIASAAGSSQGDAPLAAVDEANGVAMIGGKFVEESYEKAEGYDVDTSGYGNFAFLTNLVDVLGDGDGPVLVAGGQGQFNADHGISAEDAAYYQRYLEGVGIDAGGINDLTSPRLSGARALLVTGGVTGFSDAETAAVADFAANGGAVVVLGASSAPSDARSALNDLAAAVGTDLRLSGSSVTDDGSNLAGDASVPVTGNFDTTYDLFSPYGSESDDDGDDGTTSSLSVTFPNGNSLGQGSTVRADVVLSEAPQGLAGFDVEAQLSDANVASVASASVPDQFGLTDVSVAGDGSSVVLEASDTQDAVEAGATDVTVASLELAPGDAGTTEVALAVDQVDADDGSTVDTTTVAGTLEVAPVEAIGDNPLPTDVDDDGVYEDLNGNGRVDSQDVVLFFENREDDEIAEYVEYFDINGNGRIDFDDINDLFDLL